MTGVVPVGYGQNPNDLGDWLLVIGAFLVVALVVAVAVAFFVRWFRAARRR